MAPSLHILNIASSWSVYQSACAVVKLARVYSLWCCFTNFFVILVYVLVISLLVVVVFSLFHVLHRQRGRSLDPFPLQMRSSVKRVLLFQQLTFVFVVEVCSVHCLWLFLKFFPSGVWVPLFCCAFFFFLLILFFLLIVILSLICVVRHRSFSIGNEHGSEKSFFLAAALWFFLIVKVFSVLLLS